MRRWLLRYLPFMSREDKWKPDAKEIPGLDRPLTPQECQETADSFSDLPPEYQLSAVDLEEIQEEMFGPQAMIYGSPQEAIAAMKRRLAFLKANKAKTLDTLDDCADSVRPNVLGALESYNRSIADAQKRLDAYEYQQRNEN